MKVKALVWIGTRTEQFEPMLAFCQNVMGLTPAFLEPGFSCSQTESAPAHTQVTQTVSPPST